MWCNMPSFSSSTSTQRIPTQYDNASGIAGEVVLVALFPGPQREVEDLAGQCQLLEAQLLSISDDSQEAQPSIGQSLPCLLSPSIDEFPTVFPPL